VATAITTRQTPCSKRLRSIQNLTTTESVPERQLLRFQMESCVMSDHQLRFKGPGFDFDAKGWMAILAAIVIVGLIVLLPRLWQ
jgi:hypothetical protein